MMIISEFKQYLILFCLFSFMITIDAQAAEAVEGEYIVKYKDCYKSNLDSSSDTVDLPSMNASLLKINRRTKDIPS
ncbi:hypothetical protein [Candidatus Marithrix sp. Canyon 246]|uniref:hypothetical protein n=1 Tax=Candidatus Marithrix sp. Canyon 246 TaxID=1827136 RepID=UPI00084A1A78|nr:hypothetical protein [Candidatus Marithrix sp. Canyon 246]